MPAVSLASLSSRDIQEHTPGGGLSGARTCTQVGLGRYIRADVGLRLHAVAVGCHDARAAFSRQNALI